MPVIAAVLLLAVRAGRAVQGGLAAFPWEAGGDRMLRLM